MAQPTLYVKLNGAWTKVAAYKKVNGVWASADVSTVFDASKKYIHGN